MSSDTSTGAQGQGSSDGGASVLSREELRAAVASMSDADLCEFVIAVSADRPKLRALHQVAQLSAIAGPVSSDDAELADVSVSVAGGTVSSRDLSDVPVGEVPALGATAGPDVVDEDPGWSKEGIPTFAAVRDRIAARFAVAIGASETVVHQAEDRSLEQQWETRARLARERLEQIRGIMQK